MATGVLDNPYGHRSGIAIVMSAALHGLLLLALAATSIHLVGAPDRQVLPLVIREPAPLPPPGPGTAPVVGPPAPAVPPASVAPPAPRPVVRPKPAPQKPRVAAPKPPARPQPPAPAPVAAAPPRAAPPPVPAATAVAALAGPGGGGAADGVAGGQTGGRAGGRLGGRGDEAVPADQLRFPPRAVDMVRPTYPAVARARHQEGTVVVQAVIDRSGRVEGDSLRVIRSQPPFDDAALSALRQWRFQPGRDDGGTPTRSLVQLPIQFRLR